MKLSMWILENWLSKYDMISNITSGEMIIEGARLFSIENQMSYYPTQIYVGDANGFIGSMDNQVICVCGPDWVRIKHAVKEEVFNDILQAFDFYNQWEANLAECNTPECTVQKVLDISQPIFNNPIVIIDTFSNVIAMSSNYKKGSLIPEWDYMLENNRLSLASLGKLKKYPELLEYIDNSKCSLVHHNPVWKKNTLSCGIYVDDTKQGIFNVFENDIPLTKYLSQLADIFIQVVSTLMSLQKDIPEFKPEITLAMKLLKGDIVLPTKQNQIFKSMGWKPDSNFCLYKIKNLSSDTLTTQTLVSRISQTFPFGICFEYEDSILYLFNDSTGNIDKTEKELGGFLKQVGFVCGASFIFNNIEDIQIHYKQASLALSISNATPGVINHCFHNLWNHVSNICKDSFKELQLYHPSVIKLLEYDNEHGTKFLETLYYYLRNERRLTQTSKAMFLHRNTLFYRVERIQEIMDTDMDDPDERDYIMLSIHIMKNEMNFTF